MPLRRMQVCIAEHQALVLTRTLPVLNWSSLASSVLQMRGGPPSPSHSKQKSYGLRPSSLHCSAEICGVGSVPAGPCLSTLQEMKARRPVWLSSTRCSSMQCWPLGEPHSGP